MSAMSYFSYEDVHGILAGLSSRIKGDGLVFDYIIAIGAGGYVPARILQTYFQCPVLAVTVASYTGSDLGLHLRSQLRIIQWLGDAAECVRGRKVLLVDEIDDTRSTIAFCARKLLNEDGIDSLVVAVLHNKSKEKLAKLPDNVDYYEGDEIADQWIVYPWEASNIREHSGRC